MCERLLANPLVEDYEVQLLDGSGCPGEVRRSSVPGHLRRGRCAAGGPAGRRRGADLARRRDLDGADAIIVPGGFSYGDYLRAGAIARFSPAMESVIAFAERRRAGAGDLQRLPGALRGAAAARRAAGERNLRFTFRQVELEVLNSGGAFTRACARASACSIPAKHAWGRYYADPSTLPRWTARAGACCATRPGENFNGSLHDIAGVRNERGNVFGLMPHPEHAVDELTGGSTDGLKHVRVDAPGRRGRPLPDTRRCRPCRTRSRSASPSAEYELVCEKQEGPPNQWSWRCTRCCGASTAPTSTPRSCCARCPPRGARGDGAGRERGRGRRGRWAVCAFKVESHNHPSAVEPFQGAATGVGGILRDIFAIGARPIAVLDSLRFGEPSGAALALPARRGRLGDRALRQLDRRAHDRRRGLLRGLPTSRTASSTRWRSGCARERLMRGAAAGRATC